MDKKFFQFLIAFAVVYVMSSLLQAMGPPPVWWGERMGPPNPVYPPPPKNEARCSDSLYKAYRGRPRKLSEKEHAGTYETHRGSPYDICLSCLDRARDEKTGLEQKIKAFLGKKTPEELNTLQRRTYDEMEKERKTLEREIPEWEAACPDLAVG